MGKRAASLVQADYDRAVKALTKAGLRPDIIFDLTRNTVTVTAATNENPKRGSTWRERAPDRV
jgi:hypothetical protein